MELTNEEIRMVLAEHVSKVNSGAFRVGRTWYRLDMFERYGRYAESMKEVAL